MMRKRTLWLIVPILTLGIAALVGCAILRPIGSITIIDSAATALPLAPDRGQDTSVQITAYLTGWVEAPADILIDQSDPRTPSKLGEAQWVPSLAYAIRHPEHGIVILDTGLKAGACDYGLRPIYWVPCRNEPGSDIVSQLIADGVTSGDIRFIIPSHFHGDHISGLSSLLGFADATVLTTRASISEMRSGLRFAKGIPAQMLSSDMKVQLIDNGLHKDALGIDMYDVFGDGSLKLFETPGHSEGHISAIARGLEQDVLFTFDASHLKANLELDIPSGAVRSRDNARSSLATLRDLVASLGNPLIVYGHEPEQWACVKGAARLGFGAAVCN